MWPINFWPATNLYWPLDYWTDYPAAAAIVTVAATLYVPSPTATLYIPRPSATKEIPG